jgi:hypothetical protein
MEAHMGVYYSSQTRDMKWYMAYTESQTKITRLLSENSLSLETRNN